MSLKPGGIPAALLAAAASAGLFALFPLLPPFGYVLAVVSPLPLATLGWHSTPPRAVVAALMGALAVALLTDPFFAVQYLAPFAAAGVLVGVGVRRNWAPERILGWLVGLSAGFFVAYLTVQARIEGLSPLAYLQQVAAEELKPMREALKGEELDPQTLLALEASLDDAQRLVGRAAVGILAGFTLLLGWINALWLRRSLARRGVALPTWADWKAPEHWIWALIVSGGLLALGDETLTVIGLNVLIPLGLAYFLQGLAIVQRVFDARDASWFIRGVTFALIFLQLQFTAPLLALAGAFDPWIDFRGRWAKPKGQADTEET